MSPLCSHVPPKQNKTIQYTALRQFRNSCNSYDSFLLMERKEKGPGNEAKNSLPFLSLGYVLNMFLNFEHFSD